MVEKGIAVTDGNHIVMKNTAINGLRVLLGKDHITILEPMQSRHRLGGFQRLPRRVFLRCRRLFVECNLAVHEKFHTGFAVTGAQAGVVGGALIPEVTY